MLQMLRRLRIILSVIFLFQLALTCECRAAQQAETEELVRKMTPPLSVVEKTPGEPECYVDSFYEISNIHQGSQKGHWSEMTNMFGCNYDNVHSYFSISRFERLRQYDYTANVGSYISLKNSYLHYEAGFAWDINYIYKFQSIAEYSHKLYDTLYWQIGYNYRNYEAGDTHLIYPGLIYYFGDSYISGNCGVSGIEDRGFAEFGTIKGNFAITPFLRWYGGFVFGERLYDIFGLHASKERGYIVFTGANIKIYKGISCRVGCSYGTERPKFIKRSLDFAVSVKF